MAANESPSYVIVAGIDFSRSSALALDEALRLAAEHPGAVLQVVHVASSYGPMVRLELEHDIRTVALEEATAAVKSHVQQRVNERKAAGLAQPQEVTTQLCIGGASEEIVRAAAELEADLLVVGTHGRTGVKRLLLGSVAEAIVRKAGCPVLVVREKDYPAPSEAG
jgi:nucleotide-binding universal stress UspA family protein